MEEIEVKKEVIDEVEKEVKKTEIDLVLKKEAILKILDYDFDKYMHLLNKHFKMSSLRLSKEEFDIQIMYLIPDAASQLHRDFMCALDEKTQATKNIVKLAFVRAYRSFHSNRNEGEGQSGIRSPVTFTVPKFVAPLAELPPCRILRYPSKVQGCYPVAVLPKEHDGLKSIFQRFQNAEDTHGRILATVLQHNLDGVQQSCITVVMRATESLLKNIISAVLHGRGPDKVKYTTGRSALFPQKRLGLESASDMSMATSLNKNVNIKSCPVSARELFETLRFQQEIIPNRYVHSLAMRRIGTCLNRSRREDCKLSIKGSDEETTDEQDMKQNK